jgi:hypothetical protein
MKTCELRIVFKEWNLGIFLDDLVRLAHLFKKNI